MSNTNERPGSAPGLSAPSVPGIAPPPFTDAERHRLYGHAEEDLAFFQTYPPVSPSPPKDEIESEKLGERIRAVPRQCWFNARRAVMRLKGFSCASYVEGWAVCDSGRMIEHGWIVRDGVLLDPTLPTGVDAYFPGLEFPGRDGISAFFTTPRGRKCKRSPFFYAFGWGGTFSPTMWKAQAEATDFVTKRFCTSI